MKSLHVQDNHMAFWSKFIQSKIHNYIKPKEDRNAIVAKTLQWGNHMLFKLRSSGPVGQDSVSAEIAKFMDSIRETERKPFWQFTINKSNAKECSKYLDSTKSFFSIASVVS